MAKRKETLEAPEHATPLVETAEAGQVFLTAEQLSELGLDPATGSQTIQDAGTVFAQIKANPWITRESLVKWAVSQWPEGTAVDRLNAAVTFLEAARRIAPLSIG